MNDDNVKHEPIKNLIPEEGAHELATSPDMQPYLQFMKAEMQGHDTASHWKAISDLPLEKRYVWRVASAMKWGFADFDSENIETDRQTLNSEDFAKVRALLRLRPIQFCMFLKAFLGEEEMEQLMKHALSVAKQAG